MNSVLVWINFLFYPCFALFMFLDFLGLSFVDGFLAALAYLTLYGLLILTTVAFYLLWDVRWAHAENIAINHFFLKIHEWWTVQIMELVTGSLLLWFFYTQHRADSNTIARAFDQTFQGFVDWRVLQVVFLSQLPLHFNAFSELNGARTVLTAGRMKVE